MNQCDPDKLTAYVDGALDDAARRSMDEHLRACPLCAAIMEDHRALRQAMAGLAGSIAVPPGLSRRVGAALDRVPPPRAPRGGWRRLGVPGGLAVLVTTAGLWFAGPLRPAAPVDVQALMWHHRDAMHPPARQSVLTSDRAEARRWLEARLSAPVAAPALPLPLRGAGICRVDGAPAAIWMYRDAQPVSLIEITGRHALPAWEKVRAPGLPGGLRAGSFGGYHAVVWQQDGRTFAVVSGLPSDRLLRMVEACR